MKEKKEAVVPQVEVATSSEAKSLELEDSVSKLSETDRMELELSKMRRKLAIAEAEKALSESNRVELEYKYIVLQIYMKYKLTAQDAIDEQGNIIFGGAKQKQQ